MAGHGKSPKKIRDLIQQHQLQNLSHVTNFNLNPAEMEKEVQRLGQVDMIIGHEEILVNPQLMESFWNMMRGLLN